MTTTPINYEAIVEEVYEVVLRGGDVAIDIGAHTGRHTFPLAHCVGPTGKVYAVEPLPACQETLHQQLKDSYPDLLPIVQVVPHALGEWRTRASFVIAEDHLPFSGLRPVPYPSATRTRCMDVEVETLDRLFLDGESVRYIKLDAEGAELHILRGGRGCLAKFRPVIGFEFGTHSNREYQVAPDDMAAFWNKEGYHIYAITGQRLNASTFVATAQERAIWDYVAVPREDEATNALVFAALNRPRINWLAVRAELNHAKDHADIGARVPPLRRFRGPLWPVARGAAWLWLQAAKMITVPQRFYNVALLNALNQLAHDLEISEAAGRKRERQIAELTAKVEELERRLALSALAATRSGAR